MKVTQVKALGPYRLEIEFDDGFCGVVELGDLQGQGVFAAWDEPGAFADVAIGSGGELVWRCGVDYCADALYLRATGKTAEQIMPGLAEHRVA